MKPRAESLILLTAIGIVATFAAPWVELRGTYAAWRIVEWHTFWRGGFDSAQPAFQLASVVASDYRVPIEYATAAMQNTMRDLVVLGNILGAWHSIALIALLVAGVRFRLRAGASKTRVALEIIGLITVNVFVLYALTVLLALPSSLTEKVDFRSSAEIHTDSLIWSSVNVLPIAPVLSLIAAIGQAVAIVMLLNRTRTHADKRG